MVANKLNEVAGKGWAWYSHGGNPSSSSSISSGNSSGPGTSTSSTSTAESLNDQRRQQQEQSRTTTTAKLPNSRLISSAKDVGGNSTTVPMTSQTPSSSSSYFQHASDAAESTYNYLTSYLHTSLSAATTTTSATTASNDNTLADRQSINSQHSSRGGDGGTGGGGTGGSSTAASGTGGGGGGGRRSNLTLLRQGQVDPSTLILSPTLYKMIHNPYISVRGGRQNRAKRKSMEAVRNLIYVTTEQQQRQQQEDRMPGALPDSFHTITSVSEDDDDIVGDVRGDNYDGLVSPQRNNQRNYITYRPQRCRTSSGGTGGSSSMSLRRSPIILEENDDDHDDLDGAPSIPSFLPLKEQGQQTSKDGLIIDDASATDTNIEQTTTIPVVTHDISEHMPSHLEQIKPSHHHFDHYHLNDPNHIKQNLSSPEETASQLAEGTLRAFRDLALDEAVELHSSLQYWTERWERPLLSWLEAGPWVWFSSTSHRISSDGSHPKPMQSVWYDVRHAGDGYNHQQVGQKVSQIQAVLARRLSTIGELQQHLLRAGWQRGVAQWGFLGEGGEWAQVPATDGRMAPHPSSGDRGYTLHHYHDDDLEQPYEVFDGCIPDQIPVSQTETFDPAIARLKEPYRIRRMSSVPNVLVHHTPVRHELPSPAPRSSVSRLPGNRASRQQLNQLYYTNLFVKKKDDGQILRDDHALAEWSVDAIALIRSQLYRAANGQVILPYSNNWSFSGVDGGTQTTSTARSTYMPYSCADQSESADNVGQPDRVPNTAETRTESNLPAWATLRASSHFQNVARCSKGGEPEDDYPFEGLQLEDPSQREDDDDDDDDVKPVEPPLIQKLTASTAFDDSQINPSPPQVTISDLPLLVDEVSGLLDSMEDVMAIQRARRLDRLKPPSWLRQNWYVTALALPSVTYLWYRMVSEGYGWSTLKYASRQILYLVREHVLEPCRAMYNELTKGTENISDRAARDTAIATLKKMIRSWLDESYPEMPVEKRSALAEAMDISLLEETKEKALNSIYELNNVIRMSFIEAQFIKKEMMNALVALDEMQASTNFNMNLAAVTPVVLFILTIKRVSQFIFYSALKWGKSRDETYSSFLHTMTEIERLLIHRSTSDGVDTFLDSDDLGMLMLHLHELRTLLWKERRRFSTSIIRSVNEDLAELSGERGVVSVRQQLLIVERMARTYGFLKLASSQNHGQ